MLFLTSILLLGCSVAIASGQEQGCTPTVHLKNGSYYGLRNAFYGQDMFLGMPYAQPPLGPLRFNNPVPLNSTWSDMRNATQYSPECYGYGSDDWVYGNLLSEDCLTINVIRPSGLSEDAKLPVGVWIYGGGGSEGGSLDQRYNLTFVVQQSALAGKPIIGVSLNYRLQSFGFIFGTAVQDAGVANLGYKDQRLALHWVHENIDSFGGDPSKVAIWGESAGASSVSRQLLAYGGRDDGLFRAAIQESGGFVNGGKYLTPTEWDPYYDNITAAVNCGNASDTLACLRRVPIDTLSPVLNSSVTDAVPYWGAQIDGDFVQESGTVQLAKGSFVKVPLLHGTNHDEGAMFAVKGINNTEQFLESITAQGPDNTTALTIAALYPDIPAIGIPATEVGRPPPSQASLGVQYKRAAAYGGDLSQHARRRLISEAYATFNVTSYSYLFNVLVNGLPATTGATHFQEVAFVFNNIQGLGYENAVAVNPFKDTPASYKVLAQMMSRMWVGFIHDLDPNTNGGRSRVVLGQ